MGNEIDRNLWAKSDPPHPLWKHLLDVGAVTRALWPRFGPLQEMPIEWACALNALHDIGKADPWFQNKDEEEADKLRPLGLELPERLNTTPDCQRLFRHEARSHEWLVKYLTAQHGWSKAAAKVVTMAISGHHGTFGQDVYAESEAQSAIWNPWRDSLARMVWDVVQPPPYAPAAFEHAGALGITLSGLLILSDWIASNPETFRYTELGSISDPHEYFQAACAEAQASVRRLGLEASSAAPEAASEARSSFHEVWPQLREFDLRPSQRVLEAQVLGPGIEPGLAIIEEQMGAGKTEMAVYLAEHWNAQRQGNGVYIGLPTQATGNQMHARYGKYLSLRHPDDPSPKARLVHGMAWLIDEETTEQAPQLAGDSSRTQEDENLAREWFRPLRRALLARDGVGTVDQAMMAALHVKFGSLRLLGLRSKVLVIDEAHAYDTFMSEILGRLLAWCRALQIPVVLLSATLSRAQKAHLVQCYGGDASIQPDASYPLLTLVSSDGAVRTVKVDVSREPVRTLHLKPHLGALDDAQAASIDRRDIKPRRSFYFDGNL